MGVAIESVGPAVVGAVADSCPDSPPAEVEAPGQLAVFWPLVAP